MTKYTKRTSVRGTSLGWSSSEHETTSGVKKRKMAEQTEKVIIFTDSRGYNLQEFTNSDLKTLNINRAMVTGHDSQCDQW